jgi:phage-related protein
MGITFINPSGLRTHSDDLGFSVLTDTKPYIPKMRKIETVIPGRDGAIVHETGYDNIVISLNCGLGDYDINARRVAVRQLATVLSTTRFVILDYEPNMQYTLVSSIDGLNGSFQGNIETFKMELICKPYQEDILSDKDWVLGEIETTWETTDLFWGGPRQRVFPVSSGVTMTLYNDGTYKAKPLIKLTGICASVTFGGMTYINLNGTVYIDCENRKVYSISGSTYVNRIANFSGNEFLEIGPGVTNYVVTGSITNLTITFEYRDTFL